MGKANKEKTTKDVKNEVLKSQDKHLSFAIKLQTKFKTMHLGEMFYFRPITARPNYITIGVLRVFGGWIFYKSSDDRGVFVPEIQITGNN